VSQILGGGGVVRTCKSSQIEGTAYAANECFVVMVDLDVDVLEIVVVVEEPWGRMCVAIGSAIFLFIDCMGEFR
jgi:hypothetical protein